MGVPAFFRWLSEKYPRILQDILEERVKVVGGHGSTRIPFDSTRPNPSGLECDNLYVDMNGIIHPCSHPEQGPQPKTEEEMYENVCLYVDRLFRVMRPRKLLYLAIDGVAPRAKMNQQRARRFRSAQEARENHEVEQNVRDELTKMGQKVPPAKKAWDSNVITPGTPFMLRLSEYIRFYIRKRISTDKAWQKIRVIFSDASIPGEGEHKIMSHIRLQRSQPGYSPNLVHILHGLDADLIMLALATHETHFYISREEVLFGRKSQEENEKRQIETMFREKQRALDEEAGDAAMQLLENKQKPLVRVSIPILREYLANEFASCITPGRIPFQPSLERLIDDIVFLCFFVGNDFLPHLPSLDIRVGALDFLFNVYKRILPTLGDYITNHGGQVNLSHVDVILAEVGSIEDYVFSMKHENELREQERREQLKERKKVANGRSLDAPPPIAPEPMNASAPRGRAAKILARQSEQKQALIKKEGHGKIKVSHMRAKENENAAEALKRTLMGETSDLQEQDEDGITRGEQDLLVDDVDTTSIKQEKIKAEDAGTNGGVKEQVNQNDDQKVGTKRKLDVVKEETAASVLEPGVGEVGKAEDEFDVDDDDDDEVFEDDTDLLEPKIELDEDVSPEVVVAFKDRVKNEQQKKLDEYSRMVEDKVRLHEKGWKDRYYSDKCKADDVAAHGGREHLFRSYVMGLCWVMKYYYDGCPSWKWFYPFHYAPFASDLRNIERFQNDVKSFELSKPFNPVEQLMAVLPSDSVHAIPKEARWLMTDPESPIIDFYPKDVPVDPNGKAMPWLWVVLLPFIDEDRLLAALTPTMAKWTKEELYCNARGLDDGYLFCHSSFPLASKLSTILQQGKTAKSPKMRLLDSAAYGCPGFSGSVRPPLSNEIYSLDEEVKIHPPKSSSKAEFTSHDNLFTEPVLSVDTICVAFTEPSKLSHKSIVLPGAIPLPPCLTADDKRIRRPRLNRGGGTIANMGMSNGQSYQTGYGSMNISSYERELAQRTGRGNQMHQAGTRAWGAMEPTPKRQFHGHGPFQGQSNGGPPSRQTPQSIPPWQQNHHHSQQYPSIDRPHHQGPGFHQQGPPNHQQQMHQQYHRQGHQSYQQQNPMHGRQQQNQQYPQHGQVNPHVYNRNPPPPPSQPPRANGPHGQRQGFDFRGYGQQPPVQSNRPGQPQVNPSVMNSLKAQLASTLKQNRRNNK